jgi:hypothetical protein
VENFLKKVKFVKFTEFPANLARAPKYRGGVAVAGTVANQRSFLHALSPLALEVNPIKQFPLMPFPLSLLNSNCSAGLASASLAFQL